MAKLMSASGIAGVIAIVSMSACSMNQDSPAPAGDEATSSVSAALTGGVFDGNSVFIEAHRNGFADAKYPCVSKTSGCFNFGNDSHGVPTPKPGDTGAENFNRLCPTEDVNEPDAGGDGRWTFTYHIWSQPNCEGTELTADDHDFTCYTESDLASKAHPNQTVNETLPPGRVVNTLLCPSENTPKEFGFTVCQELPPPDHCDTNLDCACVPVHDSCQCPFDTTGLPPECRLDADCHIVCCACPCDSLPLWQDALSGTPLSCVQGASANSAIWANGVSAFGLVASGAISGQPGPICGVNDLVSGQNQVLNITPDEASVCVGELQAWQASHGLTCTPIP